jgi:DNA ligase D-like protein (predicted 3'-phosphoesterase)
LKGWFALFKQDSLEEYREKRDFRETAEPSGSEYSKSPAGELIFVIQKHDASRLHYDFRLEIGGVLKSWAIPKGPSLNPKDKRLAVPTEDHPISYAAFEGTIPQGQYGGGTVIVWDIGTYRNITNRNGVDIPMEKALAEGRVNILLNGKKLRGGYALTRFKTGKDEAWLLIKMNDEEADTERDPLVTEPQSALSGLTIEEVAVAR